MTNTEAIKLLSEMPKDTPLIIEWWESDDFNGDGAMTDKLWLDVCAISDRKLDTSGWSEDLMYFIDFVKEGV